MKRGKERERESRLLYFPFHYLLFFIEDMRVKYIHSDAVLFLKKNNKFRGANSAILDVKFTSSSMEETEVENDCFCKNAAQCS